MNVTVRPRIDDDLDALGQVLVEVHSVDEYPVEGVDDPVGWLQPPHLLAAWTALIDKAPIGHIALTAASPDDDAAKLWREWTGRAIDDLAIPVRLFVAPTHRTAGVGRMLMAAAQRYASAKRLAAAFDVMVKDRAAIRLYESLGCIRLGEIVHRHSDALEERAVVYAVPRPTRDDFAT